jgi:adenylosuccinate synthase
MISIFKKWKKGSVLLTDAVWGDSGKGKCASALIPDISAKIIGGHNAGHTVVTDKYSIGLGLIPSTVIYPKTINIIGQEVVINPFFLVNEISSLKKLGINLNSKNLLIDLNSHIILPWHEIRDALSEESRGKAAIGSLHLGVGWAYSDRVNRRGLRIQDLVTNNWKERILEELKIQNGVIEDMKQDVKRKTGKESTLKTSINKNELINNLIKVRNILKKYSTNTVSFIWNAIDKEKKILFEDSHGAMLEISHGSWPYTTGVNTALGAVHRSFGGKAIKSIAKTVISVKSYQTRVGGGPLPTENNKNLGKYLQEKGGEFGTRSGRARRCGPIDLPALKYGLNIIGAQNKDEIALTKLDVLTGLKEIPVCIAYSYKGKAYQIPLTMNAEFLEKVKPVYKIFPGWNNDITKINSFSNLPREAQKYVEFIEKSLDIPITMIGTGKNKDAVILR